MTKALRRRARIQQLAALTGLLAAVGAGLLWCHLSDLLPHLIDSMFLGAVEAKLVKMRQFWLRMPWVAAFPTRTGSMERLQTMEVLDA